MCITTVTSPGLVGVRDAAAVGGLARAAKLGGGSPAIAGGTAGGAGAARAPPLVLGGGCGGGGARWGDGGAAAAGATSLAPVFLDSDPVPLPVRCAFRTAIRSASWSGFSGRPGSSGRPVRSGDPLRLPSWRGCAGCVAVRSRYGGANAMRIRLWTRRGEPRAPRRTLSLGGRVGAYTSSGATEARYRLDIHLRASSADSAIK